MTNKSGFHSRIGDYEHWACWNSFQEYKNPPCCECSSHSCLGKDETVYALPQNGKSPEPEIWKEFDEIAPGKGRLYVPGVSIKNDGPKTARVLVIFDD